MKNINTIALILLLCWAALLIAGVALLARQFFLKWDRDGDEGPRPHDDDPPK